LHGSTAPPHARVGSKLARQWKFPATLSTPIEQHHTVHRPEVRERPGPQLRAITEIVAAADHLSRECAAAFGDAFCEDGELEGADMFERNGLGLAHRDQLCDRTKRALERSKIFLSLLDA